MGKYDCGKDTECLDTIEVTAHGNKHDGNDGGDHDSYNYHHHTKVNFNGLRLSMHEKFQFWTLSKGESTYIAYSIRGKKYLLAEVKDGRTIIFDNRDDHGIIIGGYDSKTFERYIFIGFDVSDEVFLEKSNPSGIVKTMTAQELLNSNNGNLDSLKGNFHIVKELSKTINNTSSNNKNTNILEKIKDT